MLELIQSDIPKAEKLRWVNYAIKRLEQEVLTVDYSVLFTCLYFEELDRKENYHHNISSNWYARTTLAFIQTKDRYRYNKTSPSTLFPADFTVMSNGSCNKYTTKSRVLWLEMLKTLIEDNQI